MRILKLFVKKLSTEILHGEILHKSLYQLRKYCIGKYNQETFKNTQNQQKHSIRIVYNEDKLSYLHYLKRIRRVKTRFALC